MMITRAAAAAAAATTVNGKKTPEQQQQQQKQKWIGVSILPVTGSGETARLKLQLQTQIAKDMNLYLQKLFPKGLLNSEIRELQSAFHSFAAKIAPNGHPSFILSECFSFLSSLHKQQQQQQQKVQEQNQNNSVWIQKITQYLKKPEWTSSLAKMANPERTPQFIFLFDQWVSQTNNVVQHESKSPAESQQQIQKTAELKVMKDEKQKVLDKEIQESIDCVLLGGKVSTAPVQICPRCKKPGSYRHYDQQVRRSDEPQSTLHSCEHPDHKIDLHGPRNWTT